MSKSTFTKAPIDLAVVPVAGIGTRLLPATKSQPKEMLPVGRKPAVQYVVEELTKVGMRRLLFVTGPGKTSIENHFDLNGELIQQLRESGKEDLLAAGKDRRQSSLRISERREAGPRNPWHAVDLAEAGKVEPVVSRAQDWVNGE